jgi:hypothetical protein
MCVIWLQSITTANQPAHSGIIPNTRQALYRCTYRFGCRRILKHRGGQTKVANAANDDAEGGGEHLLELANIVVVGNEER